MSVLRILFFPRFRTTSLCCLHDFGVLRVYVRHRQIWGYRNFNVRFIRV